MTEASLADVNVALEKREAFIRENIETLSVKKVTRLLEEDLGLPTKSLSKFKEELGQRITEIVQRASGDGSAEGQHSEKEPSEKGDGEPDGDDDGESDGGDVDVDDDEEEEEATKPQSSGKKRKPSADKTPNESKKKVRVSPSKESKPKAAPIGGPMISKLKKVLREATIKIPPNVYVQNRDVESLTEALTDIMKKNGLSLDSTPQQIARVKSRLERTRDLEGIDTSNIVTGMGRRPRRAAAAVVSYKLDAGSDSPDKDQENPSKGKKLKRKRPDAADAAQNGSSKQESLEDELSDGGGSEPSRDGSKDAEHDGQARSKKKVSKSGGPDDDVEAGSGSSGEGSEGSESYAGDSSDDDDDGSDFEEELED